MKVFLRDIGAGFYYAGPSCWVRERERALDLKTIRYASELGRTLEVKDMEIVATSGHASCDWFMPLNRLPDAKVQVPPENIPRPLRKAA